MELFVLDGLLRRTEVIDRFESLIWTERFRTAGDFEVLLYSSPFNRSLLKVGTQLAMNESNRIMTCIDVSDKEDSEGRKLLNVTGTSLEFLLEDRVARNTFASLTTTPKWILKGTPGAIARQIFNEICRTNTHFAEDQIPFLVEGSLYPSSNIPEPSEEITIELSPRSVYSALTELCKSYDLGFRLIRNYDNSQLFFDIYSGNNRTSSQSDKDPVIFSPELDNLSNTQSITSIDNFKNVAYVFHDISSQIVTADSASPEVGGFDRRVLYVDANDIRLPDRDYELTETENAAIDAGLAIEGITEDDKAALEALRNRTRMTAAQKLLVELYGTGLTPAQIAAIASALSYTNDYDEAELILTNALLVQRGKEELAKHRALAAFDGELNIFSRFKYGRDYDLGDLVELRDDDGTSNHMRIEEQIFVSDVEGERSYPTLVIDKYINAGSWLGWPANQTWTTAVGEWIDA